jgi:hypothetical protein
LLLSKALLMERAPRALLLMPLQQNLGVRSHQATSHSGRFVQDSYRVLYDVANTGYRTWHGAFAGLAAAGVGITMFVLSGRRASPSRTLALGKLAGLVVAVFGIMMTFAILSDSRTEYDKLVSALHTSRYLVVDGAVSAFTPEGPSGHPHESWTVDGHNYMISSTVETSGFHQPGVVHQGDHLRILDVDGLIARLERREVAIKAHVP